VKLRTWIGISLLALVIASRMDWAAEQDAAPSFLEKWQANGLLVRQTFDGTKNELNPARVGYLQPSYLVDFGIKLADWQPMSANAKHSLVLSPILEWHRLNVPKKVNTLSAKVGLEYAYGNLQLYDDHGNPVSSPGGGTAKWGPLVALKAGLKRDEVTNDNGGEVFLNLTMVGNKPGWPNAMNRDRKGHQAFLWSPSVGYEAYDGATVLDPDEVKNVDESLARARIYFVGYPWNGSGEQRTEFSIEYTHRWEGGGDDIIGSCHFLTVQVTRFVDSGKKMGVGLGYDHGRDPNLQFLPVDRISVDARIRLGG